MINPSPKPDSTPLINFCFRVTPAMKAALQRRAAERSKREGVPINAGQIVREMVSAALEADPDTGPTIEQQLFDELLVAAFFARRSLGLLLQRHEGAAKDLLAKARTELEQRKRGRR